ncbi:TIGR01212 family radical SAM protein [Anaerostipes faecalis]|uniref:TIGR01212 family radical SAM protein n=1 Tax=Anaerostipes faecalis TaxID=2738446 RepID=UPI003F0AD6F1
MERYQTYSSHLKKIYGEKVYKLPVNLPVSCPNRMDGNGCTFCGGVGTGFEAMSAMVPVNEQLMTTKEKIKRHYKAKKFIAYFQNYTNTFLPLSDFKKYIEEAAQVKDIVGISVSTRPDCINRDYLQVLSDISDQYNIRISMEYGLQTVNYHTLNQINRGHTLAEYLDAVLMTASYNFEICTHLILNLPGDSMEDVIETAKIVSALPVQIVKLHSLYIPKGSTLYEEYEHGKITLCTEEEYLNRLTEFICHVRKDMVIERLFSRVPKEDASFSNWGISWWKLRDMFDRIMEDKGYIQGCKCNYLNGAALDRWRME